MERAVNLARAQLTDATQTQSVTIKFESPDDPFTISIDPTQIEDAVLNLIINAIASVDGDGEVKIRVALSEKPQNETGGKNKIELICLGAHGAGFGMRALFGSNVDRVLRQAPCPVLVTRPLKPQMSHLRQTETQITAVAL